MNLPLLNRVYINDALTQLRQWPDAFVGALVTSQPDQMAKANLAMFLRRFCDAEPWIFGDLDAQ
jgi:DNA modification methylase